MTTARGLLSKGLQGVLKPPNEDGQADATRNPDIQGSRSLDLPATP